MNIPVIQARGIFTKKLIAAFDELKDIMPTGFLRSFFTKVTSDTKEISVEVRRGTEKIAVDVHRGDQGNRNAISKMSERIYVPPFYNEYFDATELDHYDLLFGQNATTVAPRTVQSVITNALDKLSLLKDKIERSYELQASQVFSSGIVQLTSGDNIDYKRKAGSMLVKGAGSYWTVSTVDPRVHLAEGAKWLRQNGKAGDGEFNVIMGEDVHAALITNPFIDNDKIKTLPLSELKIPQEQAQGGVYHGMISGGSYKFHLWTYPQFYDNAAGTSTPYLAADYYYMLPKNSGRFVFSFASVPQLIRDVRNAEFPEIIGQMEADYVINNYVDPFKKKHVFEILSAGLAVPVSIDRIYSSKVVA